MIPSGFGREFPECLFLFVMFGDQVTVKGLSDLRSPPKNPASEELAPVLNLDSKGLTRSRQN